MAQHGQPAFGTASHARTCNHRRHVDLQRVSSALCCLAVDLSRS